MSLHKPTLFYGIGTALITPFRDGEIDYPALDTLIERQIEAGVGAIILAGTTGEASTLSPAEHFALIKFGKERLRARLPLIAGCGSNNTKTAVALATAACEAGADALLAVTPYYNKATEAGLIAHYTAIADAATRPLMLYNVPSRTGMSISCAAYTALAEHPNIVAIKEASGNLEELFTLYNTLGDSLDIYTGNDEQLLPSVRLGALGAISVYSNIAPRAFCEIYRLASGGNYRTAEGKMQEHSERIRALFCEVNPVPVKYVLSLLGLCKSEYRLPLTPPSAESAKKLKKLFLEQ